MAERRKYHHGDLRRALVDAGLDILEEGGVAALTLRGVAARAGVSHAAPAHHFPTLRDLLTALAAVAFRRFHAAIEAGLAAAPDTPVAKVRGACAGYLAFATAHPGLFRLMFDAERLDWGDPELSEAGKAARSQLADFCRPYADGLGLATPADRVDLERFVWAIAHGYADLAVDGQLGAGAADLPDFTRFLARPVLGPGSL
jgi:AcrR family transcriptional regulator